ncbi:MAG: tRNA (adenosine(37)-N6)-dimethylallyltransferase MiaA [Magnetococcales bacterium]|nr:tRNA (adenosine(37)-N6)-dimethylallyltransferase MiaA [Magnetococcales bacterium]
MDAPHGPIPLLVILGPTASGKTRLAVALSQTILQQRQRGCEIISADSRQVFRGMDIGTGKDLAEYGDLPYHLIDLCDPGVEFSVYAFQQQCYQAMTAIHARGHLPVLVGGSGLYLDAIVRGYALLPAAINPALRQTMAEWTEERLEAHLRHLRPQLHNRTDLVSRERLLRAIEIAEQEANSPASLPAPPLNLLIFGIRWPRAVLRQRITHRLQQRLESGLLAEVEGLLAGGLSSRQLAAYGLEYRFSCEYLAGQWSRDEFFQGLNRAIHQFAKRQDTWFRRMERQGVAIRWLDAEADPLAEAEQILLARGFPEE